MASSALLGNPLVKDLLLCSLCSKFFEDPRVLPCQHTFCLDCLQKQFQTTHSSSRIRMSSVRCPTCFSAAAIPIRGISSFPTDDKIAKVKELVESVMMTGILRKSRVDVLEGRSRSGSKSRPSSWTGNFDVLADGTLDDLNKTYPGPQTETMNHNFSPQTREVSTDTNDDGSVSDSLQNDCSNLLDCGIQTEICDITKDIAYDKVNRRNFDNTEILDSDTSAGRKRTRDIKITQNGVSNSKRSCHDIDSTTTQDDINNSESVYKSKAKRQGECSSGLTSADNEVNNEALFSSNDTKSSKNGIYNGDLHSTNSVSHEGRSHNRNPTKESYMDTTNHEENRESEVDNSDTVPQDMGEEQGNGDVNNEDTGSLQDEMEHLSPVYTDTPTMLWSIENQDYNMPTAVAMTSNGNVIVSEYGNCKLQFYESDGSYLQSLDEIKPFALAVDKESNIIVGDRRDRTIKVFHSLGEPYYEWDKNSFHWISGIGVTSQGYYVIFDREDCKIGVFTAEGERVHQFGHYGDGDSQLCMADFLTVDAHDRVLVCDSGHHCVKVYDLNGSFLGRFGERGTSDGYLLWPKSICVDASNNILVSDQRNRRINLYSSDGRFIQTIMSTCNSPFNIGFKEPNLLGITSFSLTGHSAISMHQI